VRTHRTRRISTSETGLVALRRSAIFRGGMWERCRVLPGARMMMSAAIVFASFIFVGGKWAICSADASS
jgi:hypothetical protein